MAVYTAQNVLGFGRTGGWGRFWMLSNWALFVLGNMMGFLYGPLAGGFIALLVIDGKLLDDVVVIEGMYFLKIYFQ